MTKHDISVNIRATANRLQIQEDTIAHMVKTVMQMEGLEGEANRIKIEVQARRTYGLVVGMLQALGDFGVIPKNGV